MKTWQYIEKLEKIYGSGAGHGEISSAHSVTRIFLVEMPVENLSYYYSALIRVLICFWDQTLIRSNLYNKQKYTKKLL